MNLDYFSGQYFTFFVIILFLALSALILVRRLLKVSFPYFFIGLMGLIVGAIIGSIITAPLNKLPGFYGRWLPLIANVFITVSIIDLFIAQSRPVTNFFSRVSNKLSDPEINGENKILVDTSVLIDGRIESVAKTGFINGQIIIPQSVLNELQTIADSADSLKRAKGRKGMDVVSNLQHNGRINISIFEDKAGRESVDSKLIRLAKSQNAKILTTDFNLNKIAKIQNIEVLNINELAESIKPILIPGEDILVKIIQEGKEPGQGVGYLSDGTMIVVENGQNLIGQEILCEVVRIFQTVAGKMVFVQKKTGRRKAKPVNL